MDMGGLIIGVGFISAAAYFPLQLYTLIKWESRWRWLALMPLFVMIPVIVWTLVGLAQEINLWPLVMIFASPLASLYLVLLIVLYGVNSNSTVVPTRV